MKKTIIAILAVVLILVGGIWLYLLLFGTPQSTDQIFANLGFGNDPVPVVTPEPTQPTQQPVTQDPVNTSNALRKLTDRPVAGAVIVGTSTQTQVVRFVEQGIGHIFEIELSTNDERQLLNKTRSKVSQAIWSPDGGAVVLVVDSTVARTVTLVKMSDMQTDIELPPDAQNIAFSDDNATLFYTRSDSEGTLGYSYSLASESALVTYSLPFTSISVLWGDEPIIYNRPSELHPGYVYSLKANSQLTAETAGGIGLTAFRTKTALSVNRNEDGTYNGYVVTDEQDAPIAIATLPEKCTEAYDSNFAWCGYPFGKIRGSLPNDWYKGTLSLSDSLWEVDLEYGEAVYVADLPTLSQTTIDIVDIAADFTSTRLIFTDKSTRNLWFYDTTLD